MLKKIKPWLSVGMAVVMPVPIADAHPDSAAPSTHLFECIDAEGEGAVPPTHRVVPADCDRLQREYGADAAETGMHGTERQLRSDLMRHDVDPLAALQKSIMAPRELAKQALLSSHEGLFNAARVAPIDVAGTPSFDTGSLRAVTETVDAWLEAWSNRKVESYLSFYSPAFTTGEPHFSFLRWSALRRERLTKPSWISVKAKNMQIAMQGSEQATVSFQQEYRSATLSEVTAKTVVLKREFDMWRIHAESIR